MDSTVFFSRLAILSFSVTASAWAHLPITIGGMPTNMDTAFVIDDVDLSQVAYHRKDGSQPELWMTFEITGETPLFLQMGVPKIPKLSDYRPVMALVGPGLPQAEVPFALPSGYGAYVFDTGQETPQEFYEPFTGTSSWQFPGKDLLLQQAGTYYVVGFAPDGDDGKFWVAVGKREQFSLADILSLPAIVVKVRLFHEVFPIGGIAMWAFLVLLALLGFLLHKAFFWL